MAKRDEWDCHRTRQEHFTDEEATFVRDCFDNGLEPKEVAQKLGCSTRSIQARYAFFRTGVKRRTYQSKYYRIPTAPDEDYLLEERIATALRAECLQIFGATWNIENANRLARCAIQAMRS